MDALWSYIVTKLNYFATHLGEFTWTSVTSSVAIAVSIFVSQRSLKTTKESLQLTKNSFDRINQKDEEEQAIKISAWYQNEHLYILNNSESPVYELCFYYPAQYSNGNWQDDFPLVLAAETTENDYKNGPSDLFIVMADSNEYLENKYFFYTNNTDPDLRGIISTDKEFPQFQSEQNRNTYKLIYRSRVSLGALPPGKFKIPALISTFETQRAAPITICFSDSAGNRWRKSFKSLENIEELESSIDREFPYGRYDMRSDVQVDNLIEGDK